jgi:hypothetical protein
MKRYSLGESVQPSYRTVLLRSQRLSIHSFALVETSHLSLQRELPQQNVGFELVPEVLAARK